MHKGVLWTITLASCLCLGNLSWSEEPRAQGNWFTRMFKLGKGRKNEAEPSAEDLVRLQAAAANPVNLRAQAEAAYHRRLAVVDKLKAIALATHDEDLERKASQLEQRTWDNYLKHTAGQGALRNASLDEQILENRLGLAGSRAVSQGANRGGATPGARAAVKED
jgi:hypothetical protein